MKNRIQLFGFTALFFILFFGVPFLKSMLLERDLKIICEAAVEFIDIENPAVKAQKFSEAIQSRTLMPETKATLMQVSQADRPNRWKMILSYAQEIEMDGFQCEELEKFYK